MSDIKKRDDSDRALARLLAEALRPPDGAASESDCPDAGLLAAYADHNLDTIETARWEEHFAGCARCQKILAVLTVSGEEPLSEAEVERFGRKLAAADRGAPAPEPPAAEREKRSRPSRPHGPPGAGLRQRLALRRQRRCGSRCAPRRRAGRPRVTAQKTSAQPSAAPGESLEARADVPPPPAAASREAEPQDRSNAATTEIARAGPQPPSKESEQAANVTQAPQQSADQADSAAAAPQAAGGLQGAAQSAPPENSPEAKVTEEPPPTASTVAPPAPALAGCGAEAAAPAAQAAAPAPAGKRRGSEASRKSPGASFRRPRDRSGLGRAARRLCWLRPTAACSGVWAPEDASNAPRTRGGPGGSKRAA